MGVELIILPRLAVGLRRAGRQFLHLVVDRRPKSRGFDRLSGLRVLGAGSGGAASRRLAVRDPEVREFDQAGKFRQGILGARLLGARGAQAPLEFVEVDLVTRT